MIKVALEMKVAVPVSGEIRQARARVARVLRPHLDVLQGPLLAGVGTVDLLVSALTGPVGIVKTKYGGRHGHASSYAELHCRGREAVARIHDYAPVGRTLRRLEHTSAHLTKSIELAADELHDSSEELLGKWDLLIHHTQDRAARAARRLATRIRESVHASDCTYRSTSLIALSEGGSASNDDQGQHAAHSSRDDLHLPQLVA